MIKMNTDLKRGRQESEKLAECWLVQQILVRVFSFSWLLIGFLWENIWYHYCLFFSSSLLNMYYRVTILTRVTSLLQGNGVFVCSSCLSPKISQVPLNDTTLWESDASHSTIGALITELLLQGKTWWHTYLILTGPDRDCREYWREYCAMNL